MRRAEDALTFDGNRITCLYLDILYRECIARRFARDGKNAVERASRAFLHNIIAIIRVLAFMCPGKSRVRSTKNREINKVHMFLRPFFSIRRMMHYRSDGKARIPAPRKKAREACE